MCCRVLEEDLSYSRVLERSSFSVVLGRTGGCWDSLLSVGEDLRCCRVLERK
jgi:hypothetical protein